LVLKISHLATLLSSSDGFADWRTRDHCAPPAEILALHDKRPLRLSEALETKAAKIDKIEVADCAQFKKYF
jgi:hypothetical protein